MAKTHLKLIQLAALILLHAFSLQANISGGANVEQVLSGLLNKNSIKSDTLLKQTSSMFQGNGRNLQYEDESEPNPSTAFVDTVLGFIKGNPEAAQENFPLFEMMIQALMNPMIDSDTLYFYMGGLVSLLDTHSDMGFVELNEKITVMETEWFPRTIRPAFPTNFATGNTNREFTQHVAFDLIFACQPKVFVTVNKIDLRENKRGSFDVYPSDITQAGFDMNFKVYGDGQILQIQAQYIAMCE